MNIVLIFADQMHKFALSKISPFVSTPNLDKICENGVTFTNAYSNNPVCTPFRGVLFSGQYSSRCGVTNNNYPLPRNISMMADAFNDAGFETGFVGKWHLGGNGNQSIPKEIRGGFKHFIGYQCYNGFLDNVCFYNENNEELRFDKHRETVCTELAIKQMEDMHKSGKPFLQVIGYQAPHYPEQPSPEFETIYTGKTIPTPPDFIDIDPYTPTYAPPSPRPFENCPNYQRYGNNMQEYLRLYYAMVSQVDHEVGLILDIIDKLGIRDETMIIFTSDHGDMQGSRGLTNKCLPYERSAGIPLIISHPNGLKDRMCETPVSGVDLYPTLLNFAGLDQLSHLDGSDLTPFLTVCGKHEHPPVFVENYNRALKLDDGNKGVSWVMIRKDKYKLVINSENKKPCLLFDLDNDPFEQENLIDREPDILSCLYAGE